MATYIKRFDTTTQYTTYMAGDPYLPNVSMCEDIIDSPSMHYTPFIPVSGVTLDKSEASVTVNGSTTLTANILPLDASKKSVTWTSSDTSKVTIDGSGSTVTLNCIGIGSSTITCTSVSDPSISATCSVTVTAIAVTGITLSSSGKTLNVGSTTTLTATITPSNATNKNVTWTSSNTSKVTVTPNGTTATLNFIGVGSSTITCASVSDPSIKATCVCSVNKIAVTGISLDKSSLNGDVGSSYWVQATISPSNATNKNVTWTSNNESVARVVDDGSVNGNPHIRYGKVTCVGAGTATITATSADNSSKKTSCAITAVDRYTVTVIEGKYGWNWCVVTNKNDLYNNDYNGINLQFDKPLKTGDTVRVTGKVVDANYIYDGPSYGSVVETFDMQGVIGDTYVSGDPTDLACRDDSGYNMQYLEIPVTETLYGYVNSNVAYLYDEGRNNTYLLYDDLHIYINGGECNKQYKEINNY